MTTTETEETIIDYTPEAKPRGGIHIAGAFLITWAAMGLAYIMFIENNKSTEPTYRTGMQLEEIEQKIAQLSSTQKKLTQQARNTAANTQAISGLTDSLDAVDLLQKAVIEIPKQMGEDKTKADKKTVMDLANLVQNISTRITDAEDNLYKINGELKQKEAFNTETYTLLKLRDRVSRGEDFHIELDLLKRLTSNNPTMQSHLTELANILKDSSVSITSLREDFAAMVNTIKQANKKAEQAKLSSEDKSLWDNVTASLSGQIKVKKLNADANDPTVQIIAKVQKALRHGDVNTAIKTSGEFRGAAAQAVNTWREELKDLNKTQQLFEKIYAYTRSKPQSANAPSIAPAAGNNVQLLESSLIDALDNNLSAQ